MSPSEATANLKLRGKCVDFTVILIVEPSIFPYLAEFGLEGIPAAELRYASNIMSTEDAMYELHYRFQRYGILNRVVVIGESARW